MKVPCRFRPFAQPPPRLFQGPGPEAQVRLSLKGFPFEALDLALEEKHIKGWMFRSDTRSAWILAAVLAAACGSTRGGPHQPGKETRSPDPSRIAGLERRVPAGGSKPAKRSGSDAVLPDAGEADAAAGSGQVDDGAVAEKRSLPGEAAASPCAGKGNSMVVRTSVHLLLLCKNDSVVRAYPVSIGAAGTPKRVSGDRKTPVGTYRLGAPRRSRKFHLTIPIAYPTAEQRRQGYTGGSIGLHGPGANRPADTRTENGPRAAGPGEEPGIRSGNRDRTGGCIEVDTNREIEEIVDWARRERPGVIHIEI